MRACHRKVRASRISAGFRGGAAVEVWHRCQATQIAGHAGCDSRNMHKLTNGDVEVVVSTGFGPRVLEYRRRGGENVFGNLLHVPGKPTPFGGEWHIRGGHRLWHAPEDPVRTYYPDNDPIRVRGGTHEATFTQPVEPNTLIEKEITIELGSGTTVRVTHRMRNRGAFEAKLALWALSVMRTGGFAVVPQPPFEPFPEALAPARPLVTWSYTRMNDRRFAWGDRFVSVRQDPEVRSPQKIGAYDPVGVVAYASRGELFVKMHTPMVGEHTDFGCNAEVFVNDAFLELETLSPMVRIPPGGEAEHVEVWNLLPLAGEDDAAIADVLGHAQRT